ncbi:MAG: redox-sensitive bicupin YhaK (pirin superfamily) [Vicingaceae bacterium]|jgi:redox-sensitive bicupin YhaK (pirin superfamily)
MKRKDFLKRALLGGTVAAISPTLAFTQSESTSTYDKLMERVGFNHLPNKELKTMKTVVHKATTRGHANHGWLDSHHSFSFANYHNPERMNFGVLRVLNDDQVDKGMGFGTHPHDNMEIISIPLEGDLEHKDSMGNTTVIKSGDVQAMSAGTGIQHSEYNESKTEDVKFLQIWLFPNQRNVTPRYDQISIQDIKKKNELFQILSPNRDDEGVWIHQDAWFHLGEFDNETASTYQLKKEGNGVYFFVLEGNVEVQGENLNKRDGFGVWDTSSIAFIAAKGAKFLAMEVPMNI